MIRTLPGLLGDPFVVTSTEREEPAFHASAAVAVRVKPPIPPAAVIAASVMFAIVVKPPAPGRTVQDRTAIVAVSVKNAVTTGWIGHADRAPVGFCHGFASGKMGCLCGPFAAGIPLDGKR
jgi:hypothetical protein